MSNVIQIKHGASAPGDGVLAPYELGYADDGGLYIGIPSEGGQNTISQQINTGNNFELEDEYLRIETDGEKKELKLRIKMENLFFSKYHAITKNADSVLVTSPYDSDNLVQMYKTDFIKDFNLLTSDSIKINSNNYGTQDPNIAGIAGVTGQLYFVIQE